MKKKKKKVRFSIKLALTLVVTAGVFTKIIIPIKIQGDSMYPTLHDKDTAIVNALYLNKDSVKRFDIIVLDSEKLNRYIIKRIIGLPGDKVVYKDDKLYINDIYYAEEFLDKEYVEKAKIKYNSELFTKNFEIVLGKDEIFVLGDNRLNSVDSRTLGTFKYSDIIGKRGLIVFPFKDMKFIE